MNGPTLDSQRLRWIVPVALSLVVVIPFLPILGNGFAGWDDTVNFLVNRDFRGLGPENLRWAWTTYLMGVYQPIGWMIYEAEYVAWGLNPRGYHLVSIAFHTANALGLWYLCRALIGRLGGDPDRRAVPIASALAVCLYAVHPLRVEAVAWASCQSYLPGVLLAIFCVLAYLKAVDGRARWLAIAWACFALAMFTKVAVIGIPVVLLILDVYPLRRIGPGHWWDAGARRVYLEKLGFAAVAVPFMVVAVLARWPVEARPELRLADVGPRLAQAAYGIWFYPIKTVVPIGIAARYPLPRSSRGYLAWPFLAAGLGTGILCLLAYRSRRRCPGLIAAGACYLVCLAPSLGLIRTSHNLAADRYCYVASMVAAVVMAQGLTTLMSRSPEPKRLYVAFAVLVAGLSCLTARQCLTWKSTAGLWAQSGGDGRVHRDTQIRAGLARRREGRLALATEHFLQAFTDDPECALALRNLAEIDGEREKLDEAEEMWSRLLACQPDCREARSELKRIKDRRALSRRRRSRVIPTKKLSQRNALSRGQLRSG